MSKPRRLCTTIFVLSLVAGLAATGCGGTSKTGSNFDAAMPAGQGGSMPPGTGGASGGAGGSVVGTGGSISSTGDSPTACGTAGMPCCAGDTCFAGGCCVAGTCSSGACTMPDASIVPDAPNPATGGRTTTDGANSSGGTTGGTGGAAGSIGDPGKDGAAGMAGDAGGADSTGSADTTGTAEAGGTDPTALLTEIGPKLDVSAHACAIQGTVLRCWGGYNESKQLGYVGRSTQNARPTVVAGEWSGVATGGSFTCAIKTDRSLWCWGNNVGGALGRGSTSSLQTEVPGKVGDDFVRVTAGSSNVCAIKSNGTLWCWGDSGYGVLGNSTRIPSGTPARVPSATGPAELFTDVEIGSAQVGAVHLTTIDGTPRSVLWSWGHRYNPANTQNANEYRFTAGPHLASASDTVGVPAAQASLGEYWGLVRNSAGLWRVPAYGYPTLDATAPDGITDVSAYNRNMCVIDGQKRVLCRGRNNEGQLGNGDWTRDRILPDVDAWTPVRAPQGTQFVEVATTGGSACALDTTGQAWCWGDNSEMLLGDGTSKDRSIPGPVGTAPSEPSCTDGIANGTEERTDCGGSCAACPAWCDDADGDGYGVGAACKGPDCDDYDPKTNSSCWIRDLFGGKPGTKALAGTIEKDDYVCVVNYGSACVAQNDPPCSTYTTPADVTLNVTLAADGTISVQAPYQTMCAIDYLGPMCDVDGVPTGGTYPMSYAVPMATQFWYYLPRELDYCRVDTAGHDTTIQHRVSTSIVGSQIWVTQDCFTQFSIAATSTDPQRSLFDRRSWITKLGAP